MLLSRHAELAFLVFFLCVCVCALFFCSPFPFLVSSYVSLLVNRSSSLLYLYF